MKESIFQTIKIYSKIQVETISKSSQARGPKSSIKYKLRVEDIASLRIRLAVAEEVVAK